MALGSDSALLCFRLGCFSLFPSPFFPLSFAFSDTRRELSNPKPPLLLQLSSLEVAKPHSHTPRPPRTPRGQPAKAVGPGMPRRLCTFNHPSLIPVPPHPNPQQHPTARSKEMFRAVVNNVRLGGGMKKVRAREGLDGGAWRRGAGGAGGGVGSSPAQPPAEVPSTHPTHKPTTHESGLGPRPAGAHAQRARVHQHGHHEGLRHRDARGTYMPVVFLWMACASPPPHAFLPNHTQSPTHPLPTQKTMYRAKW